jgi:hypothetical protein
VDGFLLRHFGIWPSKMDKNDLFDEQKIFLMYLVGSIPSLEDWNLNVDYKIQKDKILNMKSVKLDQTEIDLAGFHGKDLSEVRREKLISEKNIKIKELNEKFGIKEEEQNNFEVIDSFETDNTEKTTKQELWDVLNMKGLLKSKNG